MSRRFSANLGFLWADLPLPDAVRASARAGFAAVECHWPYDTPAETLRAVLDETGLPLISLNTRSGDRDAGEFGLAAVPGREAEARTQIDEALAYATKAGARGVHVTAGRIRGPEAADAFCDALAYACASAPPGLRILIEALNPQDVPGYFLANTSEAVGIMDRVAAPNLRLMFDCYHVARSEGDVATRLKALFPRIGHIQFAGVPDRGAPDIGVVDYLPVFAELDNLGWHAPIGAEYLPGEPTEATLGWMSRLG